jgi:hypothetical protein
MQAIWDSRLSIARRSLSRYNGPSFEEYLDKMCWNTFICAVLLLLVSANVRAEGNARGSGGNGTAVDIPSGATPILIAVKEKGKDKGDDPRDTPPPWFIGEEFDPNITCIADIPRNHRTNANTIADLDDQYGNTPFQNGIDEYLRILPSLPSAPGIFQVPWADSALPQGFTQLAGPNARHVAAVHLFYVEFPVNSTIKCVPFGWEHRELWFKGTIIDQVGVVFGTNLPVFQVHEFPALTKVTDTTGNNDPGADQAPSYHWQVGTGRDDQQFPEAWIFVDAPGSFQFEVRNEWGNYINQRLNIREGNDRGTIRATANHRLFQLYRNENFRSEFGGGSAAGTEILIRPPQLDPNLSPDNRPVNTPDTIPNVASSHPLYVGP